MTLNELEVGLKDHNNGDTLINLLKHADTDGSGEIDYTEFIAATLDANIVMREDYLR